MKPEDLLPTGLGWALAALCLMTAGSTQAQTRRFLAFDASDRLTQAMTRGVTLEVERGLFGAVAVRQLFSTSSRGSASFTRGGPTEVKSVLPTGSSENGVYQIVQEGDGRGLARALCPGSDKVWVVVGRVRMARPLTMHAVGQWPDGRYRHCVELNYAYRGEWASSRPGMSLGDSDIPAGPR